MKNKDTQLIWISMKREDKFRHKKGLKGTQISLDSTLDVNGIPGSWWSRKRQWSPEAWSSSEGRKGRQLRSAAALTILPASPQTTSQFSWISATFAQEPCAIYLYSFYWSGQVCVHFLSTTKWEPGDDNIQRSS